MISLRKQINILWRRYNYYLGLIVKGGLRTSIFDPAFLYWHYFYKNLLETVKYASGVILDIGCGKKYFEKYFSSKANRYYGIDMPYFSGGEDSQLPNANIFGNALSLPIKSDFVDTAVSFQVLEHVKEPSLLIEESYRILKKGGHFILTCPQSYPIHGDPYDFYRYTKNAIKYLLEKHGFGIVSLKRNGSFGAYIGLMINVYIFYHLFEQRKYYWSKIVMGCIKTIFIPLLVILMGFINIFFYFLNLTHDDKYFKSNYTVVAKKI